MQIIRFFRPGDGPYFQPHHPAPINAAMLRSTLLLLLLSAAGLAQAPSPSVLIPERFALSPEIETDPAVPSPEDFLGYPLGAQYTPYHRVVAYLTTVAERSGRVTMKEYGRTVEGQPLVLLTISSTHHQTRIEAIRTANLRLADPVSVTDRQAEALISEQPVLTWLSYNVHGNEGSSTETAMQVAYRLAAGLDEETIRILDASVVLIDPCLNPDGRERYVSWYKATASSVLNMDPADLEHDEPWPGGRGNHYWFDLNRDWMWLVHPESRGRIAAYQEWLPQVHVDYHEQGYNNNYFTMPGTSPRNLLLPEAYDTWADRFGRANARAFDQHRISYFTGESFDFFYPGYGSSYPSLLGAIGMLTEQGGHSRGGRAVETDDGHVLTLRQRIFDHYLTSMATLNTAAEQRIDLLRYFRAAFTASTRKGPVTAYLLEDNPRDLTYSVIDMLLQHGIRIEQTTRDVTARQAFRYDNGRPESWTFPAGTFVIRTDQPRHLFINTVLSRRMAIEDSVMYDMSTWSIPLAYNLEAAWVESPFDGPTTPVVTAPVAPRGLQGASDPVYAYVIDWDQSHAPRALAALWEAGYLVRSIQRPFSTAGKAYSRGTLIVLMGRNLDRAAEAPSDMARIADETGVVIDALSSGRVDEGVDLVSPYSKPLKKPRVGLMVDAPFSSTSAGQIWFLFDQATGFGISRLRGSALPRLDLSLYDVLILPGASGPAVPDSAARTVLMNWVRTGGTLVASEGSALWLTSDRSGLTPVKLVGSATEESEKKETRTPPPSAYTAYEARRDSAGLRQIPGSAFLGHVDTTHPLAFGLKSRLYSLVFNTDALLPSDAVQTVGTYEKDPASLLTAGYASTSNRKKLAGGAFAAVYPLGRGKVIFLTDNTQFRMFWLGPARMMQNAVLLMPGT